MELIAFAAVAAICAWPALLLYRAVRQHDRLRRRTQIEDALKHLFDREYRGSFGSFASLGGTLRLDDRRLMRLLARLQQQGLVTTTGQDFSLTREGERVARQVVRAHRLLERYFADEARLPLRDVHKAAERREHALTADQVDELDASLGHPRFDPHGDPIPGRDGIMVAAADIPVTAWQAGRLGRVTHLEDEPPVALAQILAEGLRIGLTVRLVERTPERVVLSDGDNEYVLAPAVAANVFVTPADEAATSGLVPLPDLPEGVRGTVVTLDPSCQGFSRRRLMDLGFTPGATIEPALETFARDPRAYRVRGTLIALRRDQARYVLVRPAPGSEAASERAAR